MKINARSSPCIFHVVASIRSFHINEKCFVSFIRTGAVKFNGILPWDIDGDVSFVSANFTVIEKLKEKIKNAGYALDVGYGTKIDQGQIVSGYFKLYTTNWKVDVWGYVVLTSQIDVANGRVRTKVLLAGELRLRTFYILKAPWLKNSVVKNLK